MKKTTEKAKLIYESSSSSTLIIPAILLTAYFLYINTKLIYNQDYLMYLILTIIAWGFWWWFSFQKRLLLTDHKVYITKGKKKKHSLSLIKDIDSISYSQKGLGIRLGFGTLMIKTKEGFDIFYPYLSSPKVSYEQIVYAMETKYIKLNPEFQRTIVITQMTDKINDSDEDEIQSGIDKM